MILVSSPKKFCDQLTWCRHRKCNILKHIISIAHRSLNIRNVFSLPSMETLHQDPPAESSQAADEARNSKTWAGPLKPHHKASIVRFWDRVYGISEAETLEQLISIGFLPDLRTAVILDTVSVNKRERARGGSRIFSRGVGGFSNVF